MIICDQFWAIAYQWNKILPQEKRTYFEAAWMKTDILDDNGPLCSLYKAHTPGSHGWSGDTDFNPGDCRSEGDSPAFLHVIPTGFRNLESPAHGGWGGRYTNVRENTWLDPVPDPTYKYPEGRWYTKSAWGRTFMREHYPRDKQMMRAFFRSLSRWTEAIQNDFAARADWCVRAYTEANHPPVVELETACDLNMQPGETVQLSAQGTRDLDGDQLEFRWWQHQEADSYSGIVEIWDARKQNAALTVPTDADAGDTIHIVCEMTDRSMPPLTRYQRVIVQVE